MVDTKMQYIIGISYEPLAPPRNEEAAELFRSLVRFIVCIRGWVLRKADEAWGSAVIEAFADDDAKLTVRLDYADNSDENEVVVKSIYIEVSSGSKILSERIATEVYRFVAETIW